MIWLELCTTYRSSSPVVTTTSIILCFNKHRLNQVHLENGRQNGERESGLNLSVEMWKSEQPPDAVLFHSWSLTDICGSSVILLASHHKRMRSPPCYLCGDPETYLPIGSNHQEDLATPGFVHWRQTLANRTLALHVPGGRQLFVKTCSALWIQQCSSGVCYNRRRKVVGIWGLCQNMGMTTAFYCLFHRIWPPLSELLYMLFCTGLSMQ